MSDIILIVRSLDPVIFDDIVISRNPCLDTSTASAKVKDDVITRFVVWRFDYCEARLLSLIIGRSGHIALHNKYDSVSRQHLRIVLTSEGLRVELCGRNAVTVNGETWNGLHKRKRSLQIPDTPWFLMSDYSYTISLADLEFEFIRPCVRGDKEMNLYKDRLERYLATGTRECTRDVPT